MRPILSAARPRAAFTMIEVVIAAAIFSVIGIILLGATNMAFSSERTISQAASQNDELRNGAGSLRDELRSAQAETIAIDVLGDNNHQVTFQQPIVIGGVVSLGAVCQMAGDVTLNDEQFKDDWSYRYTVINNADGRQLVRQILDNGDVVQKQEVLIEDLRSGDDDPPGFTMVEAGDMWEITVTTNGQSQGSIGRRTVIHVNARN